MHATRHINVRQRLRPGQISPKQANRGPGKERGTQHGTLAHLGPRDLKPAHVGEHLHTTPPFVIPPSTLRYASSDMESSFMPSITARVFKAFASSVVRAMCAGVVLVFQRWRNPILWSAYYPDLCLVYTFGTPIAGMLAHSPPLSLIIDHKDTDCTLITEGEEGMVLALKQRDLVHCIRLCMPVSKLQKLFLAT